MIIVMGAAGSGKSTQGELLATSLGYSYISSGALLRRYANDSQRQRMSQGLYLSDDEVLSLFQRSLNDISDTNKIVLDGVPRTLSQASWLLDGALKRGWQLEAVFVLDVSEDVLGKRMRGRARSDDTDEAIHARLREYMTQTRPVLDFLRSKAISVFEIQGDQPVEMVHTEIMTRLADIKA